MVGGENVNISRRKVLSLNTLETPTIPFSEYYSSKLFFIHRNNSDTDVLLIYIIN